MAVIEFDLNAFRAAFPAFVDTPPETLQAYWNNATGYIDNKIYGCTNVSLQDQYLNLMTAHLAGISCLIATGQTPGMVTASTIDKVSVTLQPPPERNQWQWWLNLTPYGQQLLALLQVQSVGGFYIGGSLEQFGFRKVGGVF